MSRLERATLYALAAVVFATTIAAQLRAPAGTGVVHAADIDDNQPLDVIRRGAQYAREARVAERERMHDLMRAPVSLGEMQGVIAFCHKTFVDERERAQKLEKSSAPGDRQMAKEAYQRSAEFQKLESIVRKLYGTEAQQLVKEYESSVQDVRAAAERRASWKSIETALIYGYMAEADRLKARGVK